MGADDRNERTPVDDLLQSTRPLLDRAAAPGDGFVGRARRGARRAATAVDEAWYAEQRAFETRVREAIAHLARQGEAERVAREEAEEDVRELQRHIRASEEATSAALADLAERVRHLEARVRAEAVERTRRAEIAAGAAGGPSGAAGIPRLDDFDYLAFEDRFRGAEDDVRERQAAHADRLATAGGPVADLGCGRGELLELLRERGVEAVGVDTSTEMVAIARDKGLAAEAGDLFAFLAAQPGGSLGGIVCSHVLEHLWPADHVRFTRLCAAALRPGGLVVIETPNPKSLVAGAVNFSCDPTHLRPVFPETIVFMLERAGFEDVEVEYLSPVPDERRAVAAEGAPAEIAELVAQLNLAIERLDNLVFGEQEYAVIARRRDD
jgi:2-polyprenyl-3-methyl-5-hydroxy-6-metoxy-1,4-benzoquinol methylase